MAEIIFINNSNKRKAESEAWHELSPVYFPRWVWQLVCQRSPLRYTMSLPTYQGQKVILT